VTDGFVGCEVVTSDGFTGLLALGAATLEQVERYAAGGWRAEGPDAELPLTGPGGISRVVQVRDIAQMRAVTR
jgi:hypothetical protein